MIDESEFKERPVFNTAGWRDITAIRMTYNNFNLYFEMRGDKTTDYAKEK